MSIIKKLKEREVRWHFYVALIMASVLLVCSFVIKEHSEGCRKAAEMVLGSMLDFILFGGSE